MSTHVGSHIPRLVVTGGPCGGKTQVLGALLQEYQNRVLIVPEAATWLISRGILPDGGEHATLEQVLPFQRRVLNKIQELSAAADVWARASGAELIVFDRAELDGMAYLQVNDQRSVFAERLGVDVQAVLQQYDCVLHLGSTVLLSPEAFTAACAADSTTKRLEGPVEALKREQDVRSAWSAHSRRTIVPPHPEGIYSKVEVALAMASALMRR